MRHGKFLKAETEQIKKEIEDSLDLIESRYNLEECEKRLAELTHMSEQHHFWINKEYAQEVMRERQSIISNLSFYGGGGISPSIPLIHLNSHPKLNQFKKP